MSKLSSQYIGLFSDIHIGLGQDSSIWHNILEFAEWAAATYARKGITEIIIPGDIFHNRNEISVNTLAMAKDFFKIFEDFKIYISTGNHDCYYKDRSDVNSISLLGGWNNIVLVDKEPLILNTNFDKNISLIPWGVGVQDIPKSDICIGHFEINSFKMNTYKECDHGVDSLSLFDKAPYIISGHFHHKDHRVYNNGDILYLGSPYQQNFGDMDSTRGIYIFDIKTNCYEFIENTISPVHWKISLHKILEGDLTSTMLKSIIPNNMISFLIDKEYGQDKLSLLISKLQNLKPKFFRTEYQTKDSTFEMGVHDNEYNAVDIPKSLEDFIEVLDTPFKKEVNDYLKELYNTFVT